MVCSDAGVDRDGSGGGEFRCKSVSVCEYEQLVSRGCGND